MITGKGQQHNTIETPEDEKDRNPNGKRKGKIFIIGSQKRASGVAQSPSGDRGQQRGGVRVVGISDTLKRTVKIKDRRLRSQEANPNNSADTIGTIE